MTDRTKLVFDKEPNNAIDEYKKEKEQLEFNKT